MATSLPSHPNCFDSVGVEKIKCPRLEIEDSIFSDSAFNYSQNDHESGIAEWFNHFFESLIGKLFGSLDSANQTLLVYIIEGISIALILLLVLYLSYRKNFTAILRRKGVKIPDSLQSDNLSSRLEQPLDDPLETALKNEDYRAAIRWCFINVLRKMEEGEWINWSISKTNIAYYAELPNDNLKITFSKLSRIFEYVWYGESEVKKEIFISYQSEAETFQNMLLHEK